MKKILFISLLLVCFLPSPQCQITWNMGMNVAASSFGNQHPRIATDGAGNPLIVWNENNTAMFSRWTGTAFTTPVMVNPATVQVAGADWMGPDIAAKGDTVYITYKLFPEVDTSSHIYVVRSFDGGMTFSMPYQVDQIADSVSRFPTVTIDEDGHPIVAFMKMEPGFMIARWVVARSDDFGNTFYADKLASGWSGGLICDCCPGALARNGNNILMVYRDNLNNLRDHWAGISLDNGYSFTGGMPVDQSNWMISSCPGSGPDAVIVGDTLYSAYMSSATGGSRAYWSATSVSDAQGSIGSMITGNLAGLSVQNYPRIATDGTAMAIGWKQVVNGVDQFGLIFTNDISVGFPSGFDTVDVSAVTNVDVAVAEGNVYTVWEDDGSGTIKFRSGSFNSTTEITSGVQEQSLSVYPNPARDEFTIQPPRGYKSDYFIMNMVGEKISEGTLGKNEKKYLSTLNLENGVYTVWIQTEKSIFTQKLSIQK